MTTSAFYLNDIWAKTIKHILASGEISQDVIDQFFNSTKLISLEDNQATVVTVNLVSFFILSDDENKPIIENALQKVLGKYVPLKVITQDEAKKEIEEKDVYVNEFINKELDVNYNFGNFVVGRSNAQAHLASLTVAANLGLIYNPLFIYGNSGLGKTHLLQAIGNHVRELKPSTSVCYMSAQDFVEGVSKSIKDKNIDEFKASFNKIDLLLIDDIQFIAGKDKTHEVFFTVFNNLVNNHKQICITADKLPSDIKGLEERIITRFNQGLNVNIETPEFETCLNIVKMKISNNFTYKPNIDDDVLSYLASNFSSDVRSLEGAINRLLFYSINFMPAGQDNIDINLAKEAFKDQIHSARDELSISKIKKIVCDYYNITPQQISSKNRTANISIARHVGMYLCRKVLDLPYDEIGDEFGKKNHSTVISACQKVDELIKTDPLYQKVINELESRIKK